MSEFVRKYPVISLLVLALIFGLTPLLMVSAGLLPPWASQLGALSSSLAAIVLVVVEGRKGGLRELLGRFLIWRVGEWPRDLDVTIDAGATDIRLLLPSDAGARVWVEAGPHTVEAAGLTKVGEFCTNAAHGLSDVTTQADLEAGIGLGNLLEIDQETEN